MQKQLEIEREDAEKKMAASKQQLRDFNVNKLVITLNSIA